MALKKAFSNVVSSGQDHEDYKYVEKAAVIEIKLFYNLTIYGPKCITKQDCPNEKRNSEHKNRAFESKHKSRPLKTSGRVNK